MKKRIVIWLGLVVAVVGALVLRHRSSSPVPVVWECYIPFLSGAPISASTNGTVYVPTVGPELVAIGCDGKKQWRADTGGWGSPSAIGPDGTIYVRPKSFWSTNSELVALRPDGSEKWRAVLNALVGRHFVLSVDAHGDVLFGSENGDIETVNSEGKEKWRLPASTILGAPATTSEGSLGFSGGPRLNSNSRVVFWVDSNAQPIFASPATGVDLHWSELSVDWDETVYWPGGSNQTMRALNANGSVKWTYSTASTAFAAPTIAGDGSLYFIVREGSEKPARLCALAQDGTRKWELRLGQAGSRPPLIASDGTLFLVSSEQKVIAVNPDGTVKWVFRPTDRFVDVKRPKDWNDLKEFWTRIFGHGETGAATSPVLTSKGILYVGFGRPYDTLYALNVGVGPATNSPWPLEGANAQRTRRVAPRPPRERPD